MKLEAFIRYFGAKKEGAKYYPFPRHKTLIEPFAGSAGYSVTHPNRKVKLYDISEYVVGVWDYLIRASPRDVLGLPTMAAYETLTPEGDLQLSKAAISLSQEEKWFLGFWFTTASANCKPAERPTGWARKNQNNRRGRKETCWDERMRLKISKQVEYIKHWTIEQKSYKDIDYDGPATWFIDPPYQKSGKRYPGYKELDFAHLSSWCKSRAGQVIVCEERGADWLPFKPVRCGAGVSNKTNKEVVYYQ